MTKSRRVWPPILTVAAALELPINGRRCQCFNGSGHVGGSDQEPSLVFYEDSGRFCCFGCGIMGDAVALVRKLKGWAFPQTVEFLTSLSGAHYHASAGDKRRGDNLVASHPERALRAFSALYTASVVVSSTTEGGSYLARRGIDPSLAVNHGVRELSSSWGGASLADYCPSEDLDAAGLISRSGGFMFARHRLLFFYLDGGRPVFVQGRCLTPNGTPKELRPQKVSCPVPYNIDVLEHSPDEVWITEGCIDTLSLLQMGHMAVGIPGVTAWRDKWFPQFDQIPRVIICFDNDDPGQQAAKQLRSQFRLRGKRALIHRPVGVNDVNDHLVRIMERDSNVH